MSVFTVETEQKIHERQAGLCACCRGEVRAGAKYEQVLPEKYTGKEFGVSHENGVLVHDQCAGVGEKASGRYPHTHNNPSWMPDKANESRSHEQWACRIDAREARGKFQESVEVDAFRREHRVNMHGLSQDDRVLENNRAAKEYVDRSGFSLQEVHASGRAQRLERIDAEMAASGDRWVKVYAADPPERAQGYVCRASQIDGLTPQEMGERLGVNNKAFEQNGVYVVEFEKPLTKGDLHYKGRTMLPAGEPAVSPLWPPSKGGSIDQAELKDKKRIAPERTTFLSPGKAFDAGIGKSKEEPEPMLQR